MKRFGYKSDLNELHMRVISKELKLDINEMYHNQESIFKIFYLDEFTKSIQTNRYKVKSLMKIGFLLCNHESLDT